ncbi:alpha/beta fold hydrolase [Labrys okinawensis]|uniref:alpha/beta fold hydrolase n=1 Tax=Labrys okinawensis TaxID=346911 RepID=UPI0039BC854A
MKSDPHPTSGYTNDPDHSPRPSFALSSIRGFYTGGDRIDVVGQPILSTIPQDMGVPHQIDPNGEHQAKQTYACLYRLSAPQWRWPILFCHGGGLTGALWEGRPDGGEGWLSHFLRRGFDGCITDRLGLGRSSFLHQAAQGADPVLRSKREMWEHFRIGPRGSYEGPEPRAHAETAFPIAAFDQFAKAVVPRWDDDMDSLQRASQDLIENIGPCIVFAHSSASGPIFRTAAKRPDLIKGVVAIEPSSLPGPAILEDAVPRSCPILLVTGDYLGQDKFWSIYQARLGQEFEALLKTGVDADWLDLPKLGIVGNSHCPMSDGNSDEVASYIYQWLTKQMAKLGGAYD